MAMSVKPHNVAHARNRILGILIALGIIIFVLVMTAISSAESKKTIAVVRLKENVPITANALITEDMVEKYEMYYKEYKSYGTITFADGSVRSTVVKWDSRDLVLGKRFAAYYLRKSTILFWDSTLEQQTKKNSYLYSMDGELLNIQMTTTNDFGDMVVPGDSLNIRATYAETLYDLPTEEQYIMGKALSGGGINSDGVTHSTTMNLFSGVQILDMLNSQGQSIFDIYYKYTGMTKSEQQAQLASSDFLASVKPSAVLLECTSEQVEEYMAVQAKGATYQMTLLPRTNGSSIIDSLSDIQDALAGAAKN